MLFRKTLRVLAVIFEDVLFAITAKIGYYTMIFQIKLAGAVVEIHSNYQYIYKMCADYYIEPFQKPAFVVAPELRSIIEERSSMDVGVETINSKNHRPIDLDALLESRIIHKTIIDKMLDFSTFLFHGAAISYNNNAIIFSGKSGTGKTTHIQKWLYNLQNVYVVNGDKPFVKFQDDVSLSPLACGSPWCGKERLGCNTMVPIKTFVCMERAEDNSIHEITFSEAIPFLMQQTYRPDDEKKLKKTLRLLQQLNGKVKFYRFYCNNFKDDCFDVAFNALAAN